MHPSRIVAFAAVCASVAGSARSAEPVGSIEILSSSVVRCETLDDHANHVSPPMTPTRVRTGDDRIFVVLHLKIDPQYSSTGRVMVDSEDIRLVPNQGAPSEQVGRHPPGGNFDMVCGLQMVRETGPRRRFESSWWDPVFAVERDIRKATLLVGETTLEVDLSGEVSPAYPIEYRGTLESVTVIQQIASDDWIFSTSGQVRLKFDLEAPTKKFLAMQFEFSQGRSAGHRSSGPSAAGAWTGFAVKFGKEPPLRAVAQGLIPPELLAVDWYTTVDERGQSEPQLQFLIFPLPEGADRGTLLYLGNRVFDFDIPQEER